MLINCLNILREKLAGLAGGNVVAQKVSHIDRDASASRHVAGVCQGALFSKNTIKWLWAAILLNCLAPLPAISASNGDQIINRVTFYSAASLPETTAASVTIIVEGNVTRTPSTVEFLKYSPGTAGTANQPVATTYYSSASGSFSVVPPPVAVGSGTAIDLTVPLPLLPYELFHDGEPVFIRATDFDQNIDRSKAETVIVTVSNSKTGDSEILRLTETGPDTGVFIGYIQLSYAATIARNGVLSIVEDSSIHALYIDPVDGSDSSTDAALVDPFGLVFDTGTGKPVNGATVELLNADGTPATVYGDNGLTANLYPNAVLSGGIATDAEGNKYSFTPGGYRFPFIAPGRYLLKIAPPSSYSSPSTVSTSVIQTLPGAPFTIVEPGSRGEPFTVQAGPAIRIDIPLDPKAGTLWLSKVASRNIVSAGELLSYTINLENTDPVSTVSAAVVTDKLPPGFRYQKGSSRLNTQPLADPAVSADGSTLTFTIGTIEPKSSAIISYITAVGAGADPGMAVNTASVVTTPPVTSNVAEATVRVHELFMQSRSLIMGRVLVGACSDNMEASKKGMGGIGIYLEDGTFVITDNLGMFHFEGVRPGSHVVQLDLDSIPAGYRIQPCEENSRFAGRAYSQFVDLQGGTMWRTDFYLSKTEQEPATAPVEKNPSANNNAVAVVISATTDNGEISIEMISSQNGDYIDYRIPIQTSMVPLSNLRLTVNLPPSASYITGSSSLAGESISEPGIAENILVYPLGAVDAGWQKEIRFQVTIDRQAATGELQTDAMLTFDSPLATDISTPNVDNLLSMVKEESRIALSKIIIRLQFPTFGTELSDEDRGQLDELVLKLAHLKIERIDVSGHTDNIRIAQRSRNVYADNTALSFARAKSVGRYLTAALRLPPERLTLSGSGEKEPIATNNTAAGRALNRGVEVTVLASRVIETSALTITKDKSGLKKQTITVGAVRPAGEEPFNLLPLQFKAEGTVVKPAVTVPAPVQPAENSAAPTPQLINLQQKSAPEEIQSVQKASAAARLANEEQVELFSALHEGLVHYRIKLTGLKEPPEKVAVTLITPKSRLYLTGTSRLSGNKINEPETDEALIAYTIPPPPDEKKFDLRLQTLLEEDDQSEALASSVTVVIADAGGNPLKTFTATAELSDNMDDINKMDIPVAAGHSTIAADDETNVSGNVDEYVEKVARTYKDGTAIAETADNGLHVNESEGILSPADGTILATQINAVRIVLNSGLTPVLTMDGNVIPTDRIGFKMKDPKSDKSLYTYIGVDFGDAGEHILQLKGVDTFGLARFDKSARISRSGEITSIRIVEVDGNIADGRTPVRVRVQLFDKDDKPVMANAELSLKGGDLRPLSASGNSGRDAGEGMVSVDSQGWITFQPVTSSGLYRAHIAYNKAALDIETYVKPKMRDWILVGIAEGTAGYNTVSGNMENLKGAGKDENFYDNERLAFFAKGTIKGEWLLTMSYDSGKKSTGVNGNALFRNIDPNTYYTLYGDSTVQGYEAASQKKLYLKIERDQFNALYGDYDTGLTLTELSRYSRRLNGIKTEFRSRNFEITAFGSETGQSFVKDELRGDGTSGLYQLSKTGIVLNSEKITIESRDRFHSEIVTDSRQMVRFIDYSIDYDSGALFFKGPITSKDDLLNPVYIVVDYEIEDAGKDALTYGGRASTRQLNGKLIVGGSYVHEGHVNGSNNLYGADATLTLGPGTQARAEIATTDSDTSIKASGTAYLAEITHVGKKVDARIYYREQESGFGLGQQKESEKGTRKFGAEGGYRLNNHITLTSQAYRQYNLLNDDTRDFIESLATYSDKQYSARAGMRYANDTLSDGSNKTSVLGTAGISWKTFNQRLTLRADHDQALFSNDNNIDFPTRTILGVDYQATKSIVVFAQEELTFGATEDTNTTRLGVRATPWSGGTVMSTVVNDIRENSDRTFATVGLAQKWQLNRFWTVDGGLDHTRTIQSKTSYQFSETVPPASSGDDFTAVSLGANYQKRKITWSNRVEYRNSDSDDKWGFITGLINEHGLDWAWTGRLQLYHTRSVGASSTNGDLRLGLVYRPPVTKWIVLNRLDLIGSDMKSETDSVKGRRIVNNLHANWKPDKKTQLSFQYGAKYVLEKIDDKEYSGYTDLMGFEGRYDINKEWDLGMRSSLLHTWETNQYAYSFGPSVGYNVMENTWISIGYNVTGFTDKDFSNTNYTAQGPYIQYRFKFDQNSVKDGLKALNQ